MKAIRLIARLDIKNSDLIKSVQFEGLRVIGRANEFALKYFSQGVDELILMDCVASLYGRNNLTKIIDEATDNIFIPITAGGGIRTVENATDMFLSGADKVAINTAAVKNPDLLSRVADKYGQSSLVLSIEAKKNGNNSWEVYTDNGREKTGLDVIEWASVGVIKGAGEILLTSIDQEGTRKGFDLDLIKVVSDSVSVPVIASGGMGHLQDFVAVVNEGKADAVAIADVLHYGRFTIQEIKKHAMENRIGVRIN